MTSETSESQSISHQNINENENLTLKRTISEILTPSPNIDSAEKTFVIPNKPSKKQKAEKLVDKTKSLNDLLSPTKEFINRSKFVLTYHLLNFFDNSQISNDLLSVAKRYPDDVSDLIKMLSLIHPRIKDKSMKTRCTKVRNRLTNQLLAPNCIITSESDSDTSFSQ
ncbi:hypothetical protein WA026_021966 [Henosepilachna vigintioctopunctata]|uniref:Uncharacterized protein n=1 Tax=Henosepilachna vigintioctopunctata TaxID=420089 RepID=A0AAW1VJ71_9CUCU